MIPVMVCSTVGRSISKTERLFDFSHRGIYSKCTFDITYTKFTISKRPERHFKENVCWKPSKGLNYLSKEPTHVSVLIGIRKLWVKIILTIALEKWTNAFGKMKNQWWNQFYFNDCSNIDRTQPRLPPTHIMGFDFCNWTIDSCTCSPEEELSSLQKASGCNFLNLICGIYSVDHE